MANSHRAALTRPAWRRVPERGTALGIRFVVACADVFGRRAAGVFLGILGWYYALTHGAARHGSRAFLGRVGIAPTLKNTARHVRYFARVALDRLYFRDDVRSFDIEKYGHEHIVQLVREKRGALLLGSHLGSFEAMRAVARDFAVPLNVVVDFRNAERVNRVLAELAPTLGVRLIALDPESPAAILAIRDCVTRGELVAILGDRAAPSDARNARVDFLGSECSLPAGPYLLAHVLRCPVYLVFCLFHEPNRYELHCEPFADEIRLDRKDRSAAIRQLAQRYADRLAHHARRAPYNWFNFYDFWSSP